MKSLKTLAAMAAILITGWYRPALSQEAKGILFFEGTYNQALSKAAEEGKPIFMDAYATWCGPCKWMKNRVFSDKKVAEFYNREFICIMVDMEKTEGPELAKKYKVAAYPTLLFLDARGNEIHAAVGFHKPGEFINLGKYALKLFSGPKN